MFSTSNNRTSPPNAFGIYLPVNVRWTLVKFIFGLLLFIVITDNWVEQLSRKTHKELHQQCELCSQEHANHCSECETTVHVLTTECVRLCSGPTSVSGRFAAGRSLLIVSVCVRSHFKSDARVRPQVALVRPVQSPVIAYFKSAFGRLAALCEPLQSPLNLCDSAHSVHTVGLRTILRTMEYE